MDLRENASLHSKQPQGSINYSSPIFITELWKEVAHLSTFNEEFTNQLCASTFNIHPPQSYPPSQSNWLFNWGWNTPSMDGIFPICNNSFLAVEICGFASNAGNLQDPHHGTEDIVSDPHYTLLILLLPIHRVRGVVKSGGNVNDTPFGQQTSNGVGVNWHDTQPRN